jgi:hypothetical protein
LINAQSSALKAKLTRFSRLACAVSCTVISVNSSIGLSALTSFQHGVARQFCSVIGGRVYAFGAVDVLHPAAGVATGLAGNPPNVGGGRTGSRLIAMLGCRISHSCRIR